MRSIIQDLRYIVRAAKHEPIITKTPSRPMRVGELFDTTRGVFIHSRQEATGTLRQIAVQSRRCDSCERAIRVGDEYEEDLATVCAHCSARWAHLDAIARFIRPLLHVRRVTAL